MISSFEEMAHQQDVYGNPTTTHHTGMTGGTQTDQYGNPVPQTAGGTGMHIPGVTGGHQPGHVLHRSGSSSSSSSSEDDGQGGRRKKGMKEKIKEKIPGMGHKEEQKHTSATTTPAHGQHQQHKGMMEKIKDKLPGSHGH